MIKHFATRLSLLLTTMIVSMHTLYGQSDADAFFIRSIYDHALTESKCYDWLDTLSKAYPGRLAGSPNYDAAADYTQDILSALPIVHTVWQQACMVPYWLRGDTTSVVAHMSDGDVDLPALALGNTVGTGGKTIRAEVVEVHSLDEVDSLGRAVEGKIVFYNRPAESKYIRTFYAYGSAVDQRVYGASRAAKYGGLAAIVRSVTVSLDDVPHTGTSRYENPEEQVPSLAISTRAADRLSQALAQERVEVSVRTDCQIMPDQKSHNVIAEIKGSTYPDEIIVVGGHLDAWDIGGGAHDDGSGCVHAMQVLHTLQEIGYQPQRTIRCVLFSNEENGLRGAIKYAEWSTARGEKHVLALESDSGGFSPRAFSLDAQKDKIVDYAQYVAQWSTLLEPYGITFTTGGSGADVGRLKPQGGLLAGLRVDSQRYFDYHHTRNDVITAVHPRELQLGAAAMTSFVYLVDKYGI